MEITLKLVAKNPEVDFFDITLKIANGKDVNFKEFEVYQMDAGFFHYLNEIQEYIIEHGVSSLMTIEAVYESVVPKGMVTDKIIATLQKYLDKVEIDNELIIVDPYFFAPNRDTFYTQTISVTLSKYLHLIDRLVIITNNKIDNSLKLSIEEELMKKKATLSIVHNTSDNYHDRFWISNKREKGIVSGSSLNGLGKKFALIDRLNTSDVREIVASLGSDGLL